MARWEPAALTQVMAGRCAMCWTRASAMKDAIESFKRDVRRLVAGERATVDRSDLTRAAVLLPIVFREDEPRLIFTTRTMNVAKHKGQISFPGGMAEPGDDGPAATALREAQEEIGLDPELVEVHRARVLEMASIIVPGHGPMYRAGARD